MRILFFPLLILATFLNDSTVSPVFGQQPSQTNPAPSAKPAAGDKPSTTPAPAAAPSSPLDAAMALYRDAKFEEASSAFEQLAQAGGPGAATAFAWLARINIHLGKIDEAEKAARKALALSPDSPTAHSALGEVYFRQGKFPEAEKEFLIPLKAGLADARALLSEGKISWYTSNRKHASQLIDKAHLLDSQDPEILTWWLRTRPRLGTMRIVTKEANSDARPASDPLPTSSLPVSSSSKNAPLQSPCTLATPMSTTEAPLERLMIDARRLRGFGLVVKLNGTSSRLLLDTGASGILVNTKIAEKAGLRRGSDIQIKGFGDQGAATGYVGYADSIQVGGLEFKDCRVRVVDRKRSIGEDGLVGSDVFQDFLVDMNFPDEKLSLSELPRAPDAAEQHVGLQADDAPPLQLHDRYIAPDMQSYERFYRVGHYILLPTLVNTTTNTRIFMVDSGSWDNSLSIDFARLATKVYGDEYTIVRGLSGRVKNVYRADHVKLIFPYSRLMQQADDVTALDLSDMSDSAGTEISGVVGFSILWLLDVKIDYRDGLLHFSYDPHRLH